MIAQMILVSPTRRGRSLTISQGVVANRITRRKAKVEKQTRDVDGTRRLDTEILVVVLALKSNSVAGEAQQHECRRKHVHPSAGESGNH